MKDRKGMGWEGPENVKMIPRIHITVCLAVKCSMAPMKSWHPWGRGAGPGSARKPGSAAGLR